MSGPISTINTKRIFIKSYKLLSIHRVMESMIIIARVGHGYIIQKR